MKDLYTLYRAQHFQFPHNDCDQLATDELIRLWFQSDYYCAYIIEHSAKVISSAECLSTLRALPWFGQLGAAYMRLKFLLEACDPRHIIKKTIPRMKEPKSPFQQAPLNEIWTYIDYTHYIKLDNVCNRIFIAIVETIQAAASAKAPTTPETLVSIATDLNTVIPTIRQTSLDNKYNWRDIAPQHLVPYPYFMFVIKTWSTVGPILEDLTSADPILASS